MPKTKDASFWRVVVLKFVILIFAVGLGGRLFYLQVAQHDHFSALATNQHQFSSILAPERGQILFRARNDSQDQLNGNNLFAVATNRRVENLAISPALINEDAEAAEILTQISGLERSRINDILAQTERQYYLLKKDLTTEEVELVKEIGLKGVWLETETARFYPEKNFLSHVLGFTGFIGDGQEKGGVYGLERYFEDLLGGEAGHFAAQGNPRGQLLQESTRRLVPARHGSSLVLTIDRVIQMETERVLNEYVQRFGAEGGSVIVADPKTGAILAMASAPGFDPNDFSNPEYRGRFSNPAIQSRYEPGSIIKPLTIAAAIDQRAITPTETYIDTGGVRVNNHTIRNSDLKAHGQQTMTEVLEKSLNTGMVYIQQKLGNENLVNYFEKFGFSEPTGITLPGEVSGDLRNMQTKTDIAVATGSFGQGMSVSPIQIIRAFSSIANNGEMTTPYIISEIRHEDGSREVVKPRDPVRVISARAAAQTSTMMVNVVENVHGRRAGVEGYYIAGKTGTAQVPATDRRGYDPNKTIGSFIGFGPAEDPAFLMLVKIDNPRGVRFAESTAAPAFGEIARFILNYLQIPPTKGLE